MVTAELTAIDHYFVGAEVCAHWGFDLIRQVGEANYLPAGTRVGDPGRVRGRTEAAVWARDHGLR